MSVGYKPVVWTVHKRKYDRWLGIGIFLYLGLFIGITIGMNPLVNPVTVLIRATGTLAILMLHIILLIGPLARLDTRFLPILYNRRHFGVSMFLIALIHAILVLVLYNGFGDLNPISSIFLNNTSYGNLLDFPFQVLGFFGFIILFLMAATSHDFWLHNLGPKFWKALHMFVYVAYALLVFHVLLGTAQLEKSLTLVGLLGFGMLSIIGLHVIAGFKSAKLGRFEKTLEKDGFVKVCNVNDIESSKAKMVIIDEEPIAIFKYDGKLSAVHNFCKHQNGPLSEGEVIDGCITCPWHGYQYLPENGQSPPPFQEKVHTYSVKCIDGQVWVNPKPHPEGTSVEPAIIA